MQILGHAGLLWPRMLFCVEGVPPSNRGQDDRATSRSHTLLCVRLPEYLHRHAQAGMHRNSGRRFRSTPTTPIRRAKSPSTQKERGQDALDTSFAPARCVVGATAGVWHGRPACTARAGPSRQMGRAQARSGPAWGVSRFEASSGIRERNARWEGVRDKSTFLQPCGDSLRNLQNCLPPSYAAGRRARACAGVHATYRPQDGCASAALAPPLRDVIRPSVWRVRRRTRRCLRMSRCRRIRPPARPARTR